MFNDARLKIKRADQHIKDLNSTIETFIQTDFCTVHIEKEADTGRNIAKFGMTRPFPCDVPLIIGDAVHNLRAALDLMVCEIVTVAGSVPDKYLLFPVRETREEVISAINGGQIKAVGDDIVSCIVDTIKPYRGGNDFVHALHSLDIMDKHRLLIPIASIAALKGVTAKIGGATLVNCTFAADSRGVLQMNFGAGDVQVQNPGQPSIAILFDKGQPFDGQPVVPTLHQLSQLVSGIIETVEKTLMSRGDAA